MKLCILSTLIKTMGEQIFYVDEITMIGTQLYTRKIIVLLGLWNFSTDLEEKSIKFYLFTYFVIGNCCEDFYSIKTVVLSTSFWKF